MVSVAGSVIVEIAAVDKMATSLKLKGIAALGHQVPEAFEVGAKSTLTETRSGSGAEQSALSVTSTSSGEEKLEIKAVI